MSIPFRRRIELLVTLLTACLLALAAYTFLHEAGHALAGLAFGGRVTDFNINFFDLSAHAGLAGEFSRAQDAVINVSGVGLPMLAWLLLMLTLPRRDDPRLLWVRIIFSMTTLNTLLAWVLLPVLALLGKAPPGDDVTRFLANSAFPPLAVAGAAALIYGGGWVFFLRASGNLRHALVPLGVPAGTVIPRRRLVLAGLILLLFLVLGVTAAVFLLPGPSGPPRGYAAVTQVDLSLQEYQDETVYRFTVRADQPVGVYVDFSNVRAAYLDLSVVDAGGLTYGLLHGEDFSAEAGSSQATYGLAAGEAFLQLTSREAAGTLTVYIQERP